MYNIGIDIGGTFVKLAVVKEDKNGIPSIELQDKYPFRKGTCESICRDVFNGVNKLLSDNNISVNSINSIGISAPGSIDASNNYIVDAYNIDVHNAPIKPELETLFPGRKIFLANDANAAALAELYFGVFKGCSCALLLTLGTGLGGGLILDGKIFNGGRNHGFEPGHIPFKTGSRQCTCGKNGCAEAYTSSNWVKDMGIEAFGAQCTDAKYVIDLAKGGNEKAVAVINEYKDNLASIISGYCNMFDPEIVAIGGGLSEAGPLLFDNLTEMVVSRCFSKYNYPVVKAAMGNDAGSIGASVLYKLG